MKDIVEKKDLLTIKRLKSPMELGACSAADVANCLKTLLEKQDEVNMIFAAAPSQNEFLKALRSSPDIEWERVNAFHMDEYIGLPPEAPQKFGTYLRILRQSANDIPLCSVNFR